MMQRGKTKKKSRCCRSLRQQFDICHVFRLTGTLILILSAAVVRSDANVSEEASKLNERATFHCKVKSPDGAAELELWWQNKGENITNTDKIKVAVSKSSDGTVLSELVINSVEWADAGRYTCFAKNALTLDDPVTQNVDLQVFAGPRGTSTSNGRGQVGDSSEMSCQFKSNPVTDVKWMKDGIVLEEDPRKYEITMERKSSLEVKSYLKILDLRHGDNGTYLCHGQNDHGADVKILQNFVLDRPDVEVDFVKAVDMDQIYFNWTVTEWNSEITDYFLSLRVSDEPAWIYFSGEKINPMATSFVMKDLKPDSEYHIKLAAKNGYGMGEFDLYHTSVRTLNFHPEFIPRTSVKGLTWNSISIGWTQPEEEQAEFIDYYKLTKKTTDNEINMYQPSHKPTFYLWRHLDAATNYTFVVSACNGFTRECGPNSPPVSQATEDGKAGPPAFVEMFCKFDNISGMNYAEVKWKDPEQKNGEIEFFNVKLSGVAKYFDEANKIQVEDFGPEIKTESSKNRRTRFDFLKPNTNYTVDVCAVTRRKECGQTTSTSCKMRQTPPRAEHLNRFQWYSDSKSEHPVFRLRMPRMSQRNGNICCLRVVVVKLRPGESSVDLPHPSDLSLSSYRSVHSNPSGGGAYIAEILGANFMGKDILVGDGQNILSAHMGQGQGQGQGQSCPACQTGVRAHLLRAAKTAESRRRFTRSLEPTELVEDGFLDPTANYTAFVELIIPNSNVVGRSPYMSPRRPGEPISMQEGGGGDVNAILISILGILAGLVFVALSLLIVLMLLRRYSKKVAATQGGVEMNLRRSFRHLCTTLRGRDHSQYLITPEVPKAEIGAIPKDGLVKAYLERHKDSDYGFQAEFEMLPDRFPDRTTEACDSTLNRPKNRYPDIKCYDQTRVHLPEIEDKEGSDYINANFVSGYKNRKNWICAQGPLDHTVPDFWRMVYEQGVEIIIMLTNLEEYNRVKCAQYWPQAGDHNYVTHPRIINLGFCTERRYSDYVVRELKLTMTHGEEKVTRKVLHYHYLQWKDFNAPEHAPGMLRFVKRINEAWSGASPMVVHCSAGVGRSGTLIAIDSLMQELEEEKEVKIFQTVCGLRHHRNYLVQSVKQYMFVYRAIMEMAQFGDTEIESKELKATWLRLSGQDKEKLEDEFGRLAKIVEDKKAFSVASNDENKIKNQSDAIIPFDRNRVILTPDGLRPHSTYINASFIEGYHNDESFIITQDPLPSTAEDFWRMVIEHNICTMVMLSGDKGWNYWEEEKDEFDFGSIKITRKNTENLPSYVKREFEVYNSKTEEEVKLTHFSYNSWTGSEPSDVPAVSTGLLDLVEHATAHKTEASLPGPIAIHCRCGSDRSSVYVALSCLVQQLKNENRADVFTVVRKLRSQRLGMVQHLNQYKFIYRAITDYVDLYRSKDEEYEYSVPVNSVNGKATMNKS